MAGHLLQAGHELHVWARRAEQSKPLTGAGAKAWPTPAQLAAQCDVAPPW
jgi:3-hydroxyisobutyrate dehydrogenase-like beta-hydroxyacid dehydrogenase